MSDTLWLIFTFFVLMPGIATGLVVVAVVSARGEKRENDRTTGHRWGRRRGSAGDA
jgi:heme/copper-type cytochrome/quinol oxidase subunit 2